jgi:hypothetical protein
MPPDKGGLTKTLLLGVVLLVLPGCGSGCQNVAYDQDLGQPGASTPLEAVLDWDQAGASGFPQSPETGWEESDATEASVTLTNDDDGGWSVDVLRTDDGGWVVGSATVGCD